MLEIKNIKLLLLSLVVFCLPFMQFTLNNIDEVDIIFGKSFYFLIFFLAFLLIFFSLFLNKFDLRKNLQNKIFISVIIFWIFFNHNSLKLFIIESTSFSNTSINYASEVSFIVLIVVSILISVQILKKNIFIIRLLSIFFSLLFIYTFYQTFSYEEKKNNSISNYEPKIIFNDKINKEKNNIYFFILDAMQPIEGFEEFYDIDLQEYLQNYEKNQYYYINNTQSLHSNTQYSLTSLFYLDDISEKSKNITFPVLMRSKIEPDLIYNLNNLGYNFKWVGNFYAYCPKYNLKYCLDKKKESIFDAYLYINFFRQTPLIQIVINIGYIFNFDYNKHFFFELNNGIGRLVNYFDNNKIINQKPTFYFVHHNSPHWPYVTNSDCSYKFSPGEKNYQGYKSAYLCDLKRIRNLINYLENFDPDAFVIIQSDHNWKLSKNHEQDKKKIFNLVKLNNCKMSDNINYHNVNTMRLLLACITGNQPKYLNY